MEKEDRLLRKLNQLIDFSFTVDEIKGNYCLDERCNAIDRIQMFKYLLLKVLYDLSDRDLSERAFTDLDFEYFLGLAPKEGVFHPNSLMEFHHLRLKR